MPVAGSVSTSTIPSPSASVSHIASGGSSDIAGQSSIVQETVSSDGDSILDSILDFNLMQSTQNMLAQNTLLESFSPSLGPRIANVTDINENICQMCGRKTQSRRRFEFYVDQI